MRESERPLPASAYCRFGLPASALTSARHCWFLPAMRKTRVSDGEEAAAGRDPLWLPRATSSRTADFPAKRGQQGTGASRSDRRGALLGTRCARGEREVQTRARLGDLPLPCRMPRAMKAFREWMRPRTGEVVARPMAELRYLDRAVDPGGRTLTTRASHCASGPGGSRYPCRVQQGFAAETRSVKLFDQVRRLRLETEVVVEGHCPRVG